MGKIINADRIVTVDTKLSNVSVNWLYKNEKPAIKFLGITFVKSKPAGWYDWDNRGPKTPEEVLKEDNTVFINNDCLECFSVWSKAKVTITTSDGYTEYSRFADNESAIAFAKEISSKITTIEMV